MLISLSRKYVFLANPKAASTSFERSFADECEIASCYGNLFGRHPRFDHGGKHINYRELRALLAGFDEISPVEGLFVFAIVRDPLDRLRSIFRFRSLDMMARRRPGAYLGATDFEAYLRDILAGRPRPYMLQSSFLAGDDGQGPNFVARLETLDQSLALVRDFTGLDFSAVLALTANAGEARETAIGDPGLAREVRAFLQPDYEFYEISTDRLLRPVAETPPIDIDAALEWMMRHMPYEVAATLLRKARRRRRDPGFHLSDLWTELSVGSG